MLKWGGRKRRVPSPWIRRYYAENVGPVLEGDHVHHRCGNPWCIEPSHLVALPPDVHRAQHPTNPAAHKKPLPVLH